MFLGITWFFGGVRQMQLVIQCKLCICFHEIILLLNYKHCLSLHSWLDFRRFLGSGHVPPLQGRAGRGLHGLPPQTSADNRVSISKFFLYALSRGISMDLNILWSIHEITHIWTAVVDISEEWSSQNKKPEKKSGLQRDSKHRYSRRSRVPIPLKPCFFFRLLVFQLLKLENLLQWSFFTWTFILMHIMQYRQFFYLSYKQ